MKPPPSEPIRIDNRRDLRNNIRAINKRFNDQPEVARLLLVNPILALEDVGVQLASDVKQHIMDTLRFPPKLMERKARLEMELKEELSRLDVPSDLPLNGTVRARLLFRVLKLEPLVEDAQDTSRLETKRTRAYASHHPLVAKLAEYERVRQGGLVFHTREIYEAFKSGTRRHRWIKSVRFKV